MTWYIIIIVLISHSSELQGEIDAFRLSMSSMNFAAYHKQLTNTQIYVARIGLSIQDLYLYLLVSQIQIYPGLSQCQIKCSFTSVNNNTVMNLETLLVYINL